MMTPKLKKLTMTINDWPSLILDAIKFWRRQRSRNRAIGKLRVGHHRNEQDNGKDRSHYDQRTN